MRAAGFVVAVLTKDATTAPPGFEVRAASARCRSSAGKGTLGGALDQRVAAAASPRSAVQCQGRRGTGGFSP